MQGKMNRLNKIKITKFTPKGYYYEAKLRKLSFGKKDFSIEFDYPVKVVGWKRKKNKGRLGKITNIKMIYNYKKGCHEPIRNNKRTFNQRTNSMDKKRNG